MAKINLGRVRYPIEATVKPDSCWPISSAAVYKYIEDVTGNLLSIIEKLGKTTTRRGWFIKYIDDTNWDYATNTGTVDIYVTDKQVKLSDLTSAAAAAKAYDASFDTGWGPRGSTASEDGDYLVIRNLKRYVECGFVKSVRGNRVTVEGNGTPFLNPATSGGGATHLKVFYSAEYQEKDAAGFTPGHEDVNAADEWSIALVRSSVDVTGADCIFNEGQELTPLGGFAAGDNASAMGIDSVAFGANSVVNGDAAVALGLGIYNPLTGAVIAGSWNALPAIGATYKFAVGIGTGVHDRKDGFRVLSDGSIWIANPTQMAVLSSGLTAEMLDGIDGHFTNTDIHVTAEEKALWSSAQGKRYLKIWDEESPADADCMVNEIHIVPQKFEMIDTDIFKVFGIRTAIASGAWKDKVVHFVLSDADSKTVLAKTNAVKLISTNTEYHFEFDTDVEINDEKSYDVIAYDSDDHVVQIGMRVVTQTPDSSFSHDLHTEHRPVLHIEYSRDLINAVEKGGFSADAELMRRIREHLDTPLPVIDKLDGDKDGLVAVVDKVNEILDYINANGCILGGGGGGGGIPELTSAQWAAVNSTITKAKVDKYDTFEALIAAKQDALSNAQLNAVNSGITAALVAQFQAYSDNKQDALDASQLAVLNCGLTRTEVDSMQASILEMTAHMEDTDVHVTKTEKDRWNELWSAIGDDAIAVLTSSLIPQILASGLTGSRLVEVLGHVDDSTIHVTAAQKLAWNNKQNALTTEQLAVLNCGLTASGLATISSGLANAADHIANSNIHLTSTEKANVLSAVTASNTHIGNSDIHVTKANKDAWDAHATDANVHVTAAKKTAWDGAVSDLSTHKSDTVKHITAAERTAWNAKQAALSDAQKNAVNSGITSTLVGKIHEHSNKATLDKFSESSGVPAYNGKSLFLSEKIVVLTQAQYDALATKDSTTLYFIYE